MADFRDTIKEVFTLGNYTLLQYIKGGEDEWCVALHYNRKEKTWASGTYCFSFENALANMLLKNGSGLVKHPEQVNIEDKYGLTYDRLSELVTRFKDELFEYDSEDVLIPFCKNEMDMDTKELEYFGITESEDE